MKSQARGFGWPPRPGGCGARGPGPTGPGPGPTGAGTGADGAGTDQVLGRGAGRGEVPVQGGPLGPAAGFWRHRAAVDRGRTGQVLGGRATVNWGRTGQVLGGRAAVDWAWRRAQG